MENDEVKAWITPHSYNGHDGSISHGNMTLQNMNIGMTFLPECKQIHISLDRNTMILMRDALNKG